MSTYESYRLLIGSLTAHLAHDPKALSAALEAVRECAGLSIYIPETHRQRALQEAHKCLISHASAQKLSRRLGVGRATAYRWLARARET